VWERGCGETLACGTGACAAVAAANRLGKVANKVTVNVLGGELQVDVAESVFLSGAAEKVFEGKLF
jgi:diaminopimelate epimerase